MREEGADTSGNGASSGPTNYDPNSGSNGNHPFAHSGLLVSSASSSRAVAVAGNFVSAIQTCHMVFQLAGHAVIELRAIVDASRVKLQDNVRNAFRTTGGGQLRCIHCRRRVGAAKYGQEIHMGLAVAVRARCERGSPGAKEDAGMADLLMKARHGPRCPPASSGGSSACLERTSVEGQAALLGRRFRFGDPLGCLAWLQASAGARPSWSSRALRSGPFARRGRPQGSPCLSAGRFALALNRSGAATAGRGVDGAHRGFLATCGRLGVSHWRRRWGGRPDPGDDQAWARFRPRAGRHQRAGCTDPSSRQCRRRTAERNDDWARRPRDARLAKRMRNPAACLFCVEHLNVANALSGKARPCFGVRLSLGHGQMRNPSCLQHRVRIMDLLECGAKLLMWRPFTTQQAAVHA